MRSDDNDKNENADELLREMDESLANMEKWRKKNAEDEQMLQELLNREKPARKQEEQPV